ncbi:MAG TPA: hypothetical protein VEB43_03565 [Anaeromyxobacter sp.]|nr:hypothetical protein [Anaeromyxobacter sp.]
MRASPWWWIGLVFKSVASFVGLLVSVYVVAAFVAALSHIGLMRGEDWMA